MHRPPPIQSININLGKTVKLNEWICAKAKIIPTNKETRPGCQRSGFHMAAIGIRMKFFQKCGCYNKQFTSVDCPRGMGPATNLFFAWPTETQPPTPFSFRGAIFLCFPLATIPCLCWKPKKVNFPIFKLLQSVKLKALTLILKLANAVPHLARKSKEHHLRIKDHLRIRFWWRG